MPSFNVTADGNWHSLEMELNVPNNAAPGIVVDSVVNVWWDDVLRVSDTGQTKVGVPINRNMWGMYFDPRGNGQCRVVNTTNFWIDDLAVSTQRIGGPGGGTTPNAPARPQVTHWLLKLWRMLAMLEPYASRAWRV